MRWKRGQTQRDTHANPSQCWRTSEILRFKRGNSTPVHVAKVFLDGFPSNRDLKDVRRSDLVVYCCPKLVVRAVKTHTHPKPPPPTHPTPKKTRLATHDPIAAAAETKDTESHDTQGPMTPKQRQMTGWGHTTPRTDEIPLRTDDNGI